ncbi:hypothetical protein [Sphingomonas baiyangensis]|uniref:Fe-S oxidoreductase n=1 Tax=Sphingomonas baiyangensis TaxID=2572576 RepID=A0A4U1L330_9SPHN|nr:hypothetical protein [Sphingomonas baiyangensis]TKD50630.1 hypothetical protein FBR43_07515 [Sphingomonas baiyangensis]
MKFIAMSTALLLSSAAFAQTMPAPTTPPAGQMQGDTTMQETPTPMQPVQDEPVEQTAPDQSMQSQPMQQPMQNSTMPMAGQSGMSGGNMTEGGYMPAQPPISGTPAAGANVRFVPAPPPSQVYPAPAPLAEYPVCKRGQTDKCRNPGGV